ncbi:MAG TPA: TRAM domain-containing protein [Thermoanaerobaculia bacterium]|nr:TRAM domain-containing protein [Thermoanaerobaculia bacterium]
MNSGDEITIEATELVAGGDALARVEGFPIFTANVFPGDVAVVRLVEVKKGFARADLVRIGKPSPWRRASPCPVSEECGGCDWTALRLDRQLEAKKRILSESLRRIGKFDVASLPPIDVHASPLNYRIRSRLHRQGDAVGFYAMRSNRVVPLPAECEVVGCETAKHFGGGQAPSPVRTAEGGCPPLTIWELDDRLITSDEELTIRVDDYTYQLSTRSFFQVNRHLLTTMLRLVSSHADRVRSRDVALDLYSGVGFFTAPLADRFARVSAIEGAPESARYGRRNAARNVAVVEAAVEQQVRNFPNADFIFLDPPRAGARQEVIRAAGEQAREMVCYLSCDPVTFARDANRLTASGWRLSTLDLLDLFPNTHHVETLASFERAET